MSSSVLYPSYMPVEGAATLSRLPAGTAECAQQKLALAIPHAARGRKHPRPAGQALRGPVRAAAALIPVGHRILFDGTVTLISLYSAGSSILSSKNPPTPAKNTSAMRMPGSRFTSGTRSLAPT